MLNNFAVIGGDLRNVELVKLLAKEQKKVYIYGLEEKVILDKNIIQCNSIDEIRENADIIIGPIPFSKDNKTVNCLFSKNDIKITNFFEKIEGKTLIAGSLSNDIMIKATGNNIKIIDIMKNEKLAVLNTIATAEGTIQVMISNTNEIIHDMNILILGFGRVAKTLSRKSKTNSKRSGLCNK